MVNALVRQVAGAREENRFRSLGALELKGITEPLEAFELRWEPLFRSASPCPSGCASYRRPTMSAGWPSASGSQNCGQASAGSLRLALISGEAGVGKTRLSTHLALQVREEGATVLYGRCDEDLGVPYQPWGQALGYLVKEAPQDVIDAHVERFGSDLARLVPALRDRVPDLPPARQSDPETERYLLYAAAAGLLEGAGEEEPLLLILDDLHWADQPTLSLLRQSSRRAPRWG